MSSIWTLVAKPSARRWHCNRPITKKPSFVMRRPGHLCLFQKQRVNGFALFLLRKKVGTTPDITYSPYKRWRPSRFKHAESNDTLHIVKAWPILLFYWKCTAENWLIRSGFFLIASPFNFMGPPALSPAADFLRRFYRRSIKLLISHNHYDHLW